jgi:peptidoglycan/xylan/chitin deacetylase (PgdA/CDA1 family)
MRGILTYHSIDPSGSAISVGEDVFREQVRWLASGAVRVSSLDELLRLPPDVDAVALTFDDGYENFGTVAAPLLADHGLPVTLFVVTDRAGGTNAWAGADHANGDRVPTLALLDWDAIGRLAEGGVALGSHTRTHPRLTGLRGAALAEEVAGSAERIAAMTGRRPVAFAYPYGSFDAAARDAVASAYALACTAELRPLRDDDDPHLLPRLDVYYFRSPGRLESWGTADFRRRLWLRAQARRVRRRLLALGGVHDA